MQRRKRYYQDVWCLFYIYISNERDKNTNGKGSPSGGKLHAIDFAEN